MSYYVYLLLDPFNYYLPFYVGKGSGQRAYKHISETRVKNENKRKAKRIDEILKRGGQPKILFWEKNINNENDAYHLEAELITRFGRIGIDSEGILTNICEDVRPPIGKRIWTDEERNAFSQNQMGNKNPNFGKKLSKEAKELRSKFNKENNIKPPTRSGPMPAETKEKISKANKGKKKPEGFGEKVAENNRKRQVSEETKQKMRAAHARRKELNIPSKPRRKYTDEQRKAISERVKQQWEKPSRRVKQHLAFQNKKLD